jgi:hypothetical protein
VQSLKYLAHHVGIKVTKKPYPQAMMLRLLLMTTPDQENWQILWLAQASNLCTKEKGYIT